MSWELALAVCATTYAVLSEWIGSSPRFKVGSLYALIWELLRRSHARYHADPAAQARRTMAQVDDQIRQLHADWSIDYFQEQMQQAERRREQILREPGVEKVDLQLIGNQVALNITYAPDPELQTGESLALGGAMEIRSSHHQD